MLHRLRTLNMVVVVALATAGIAAAALGDASRHFYSDLPGTRSLSVTGHVTGYRFARGGTLVVSVQAKRCAGVARWNYAATTTATASIACHGSSSGAPGATVGPHLVSAQGNRVVRVVLAPDGVDRPDRLNVFARGTDRRIASWPLFDRPDRVVLFRGIAILSTLGRHGLYALRISDGRIAVLGIAHAGDRPIIGRDGVVYQDSMYLKPNRIDPNRVTLKLVPLAAVQSELGHGDREIRALWKITAIGMDGRRVVYAVHDPAGKCDAVQFWSPPWSSRNLVAHVTHQTGPTCPAAHGPGGVTNVATAGIRVSWTTRYGTTTRVLAASTGPCREWVVARPGGGASITALAGDGPVLAYAVRGGVGVVWNDDDDWYGTALSRSPVPVSAISVDGNRIAALYRDGSVRVMTVKLVPTDGEKRAIADVVSSFSVGPARAIALRGDVLAVLRAGHLDLFNAQTGLKTGAWRVSPDARTVDLQYGIAVIAAGRDVFAVNVDTGRTRRVLHAHGRAAAQIATAGAVVQYNAGGHGYLRFIPMSTLEARTG